MQNMNTLTTGIRTHKDGSYEGYVICAVNRQFKWSDDTGIMRIDREDAYADAIKLRDEIAEYNCLVKAS